MAREIVEVRTTGAQGPAGAPGAFTQPANPGDNGKIPRALNGDFEYIAGDANHVLKSDGTTWAGGYITNANVDPVAAIAGTKISPDFGGQTVQTTGDVLGEWGRFRYVRTVADGGMCGYSAYQDSADSSAAQFRSYKSRGTFTVPAIVADSDDVMRFDAYAHDSSNYLQVGTMVFRVSDPTPGVGSVGSALVVQLRNGGSFAERLHAYPFTDPVGNAGHTWNFTQGLLRVARSSVETALVPGLRLINLTTATAGIPDQDSPSAQFGGSLYYSGAAYPFSWDIKAKGVSAFGASTLVFSTTIGGNTAELVRFLGTTNGTVSNFQFALDKAIDSPAFTHQKRTASGNATHWSFSAQEATEGFGGDFIFVSGNAGSTLGTNFDGGGFQVRLGDKVNGGTCGKFRITNPNGAEEIFAAWRNDSFLPRIAFFGEVGSGQAAAYTLTNTSGSRSLDVTGASTAQVADVLATLIADVQAFGLAG
jgi:hypothetical protein